MHRLFIAWLILLTACAHKSPPMASERPEGSLIVIPEFPSIHVAPRPVRIWLPPGYDPKNRYPVLYMHDGQMLFDEHATWNGQSWQADETLTRLIGEGVIRPAIVVGIDNTGLTRTSEYCPGALIRSYPPEVIRPVIETRLAGESRCDDYLRFLVTEVKPYIDSMYSTLAGREDTFLAGSSMGGLVTLYALCEYPDIFGGGACMSSHWLFLHPYEPADEALDLPGHFLAYLEQKLPEPGTHRIYFDLGTEGLDAWYPGTQRRIDALMQQKGYDESNWTTLAFRGANHSEVDWSARLHIPLTFLLSRKLR